ncbi:hypothetical protein KR018_009688 [Drosophila ironensis]|nr:hypothetical protein KR018_009688 [Drosophila ironensis]
MDASDASELSDFSMDYTSDQDLDTSLKDTASGLSKSDDTLHGSSNLDTRATSSAAILPGVDCPPADACMPYQNFLREFSNRFSDYYTPDQIRDEAARRWVKMSQQCRGQFDDDQAQPSHSSKLDQEDQSLSQLFGDDESDTKRMKCRSRCGKAKPKRSCRRKKRCHKKKPRCSRKPRCPKRKPSCPKRKRCKRRKPRRCAE